MFSTIPASSDELKTVVLSESIKAIKMNTFLDNFDAERFNYDGVDRSKFFNTSERIFWLSWFHDNFEKIFAAFILFKSEKSKKLFLNLLAFRIAGHHSVRIDTGFDESAPAFQAYIANEFFF